MAVCVVFRPVFGTDANKKVRNTCRKAKRLSSRTLGHGHKSIPRHGGGISAPMAPNVGQERTQHNGQKLALLSRVGREQSPQNAHKNFRIRNGQWA